MHTVVFPHNKWACSLSLKRGNFSMENSDKTETPLSDHHFPQATCWFLSGVTVFNCLGGVVAHMTLPPPHPGDVPCLGEPQDHKIPHTTKTPHAAACLQGWCFQFRVIPLGRSKAGG